MSEQQDGQQEPRCNHEVTTRLKEPAILSGDYTTMWEWCCTCGSVRLTTSETWSAPANGTRNLPARLNALESQLAEANREIARLKAERDGIAEKWVASGANRHGLQLIEWAGWQLEYDGGFDEARDLVRRMNRLAAQAAKGALADELVADALTELERAERVLRSEVSRTVADHVATVRNHIASRYRALTTPDAGKEVQDD